MFVVYAGSILTTILWIMALRGQAEAPAGFILAITVWLWFTVLFANFAEALAEGRGKQQAATLRGLRTTIDARLLKGFKDADANRATPDAWRGQAVSQPSGLLRRRWCWSRPAKPSPAMAGDRRRGVRRRKRHHRRIRARDPRIRRRLLVRHRRHAGAVGLDLRTHRGRSRRASWTA